MTCWKNCNLIRKRWVQNQKRTLWVCKDDQEKVIIVPQRRQKWNTPYQMWNLFQRFHLNFCHERNTLHPNTEPDWIVKYSFVCFPVPPNCQSLPWLFIFYSPTAPSSRETSAHSVPIAVYCSLSHGSTYRHWTEFLEESLSHGGIWQLLSTWQVTACSLRIVLGSD